MNIEERLAEARQRDEAWKRNTTKRRILVAVIILVSIYLIGLTPAKQVSVDDAGEPKGVIAHLRATVQGRKFFKGQIEAIDKDIQFLVSIPGMMDSARQKAEQQAQKIAPQVERMHEEFYSRVPELRPTQEQEAANILRKQADELDARAGRLKLESVLGQEAQRLLLIRNALIAKTQ